GSAGRQKYATIRGDVAELPKILVTHYPIALPCGRPEKRHRRLKDLPALLEIVRSHGVQLWLHGHRHDAYHLEPTPQQPVPALCVGSGTMHGHWTYAEYTFDGNSVRIEYRMFQPRPPRFETVRTVVVPLPVKPS
ncbi:MAG TPA: metallophosphoesterase family protein, partial [Gemmatales bacterium]|nr:metallophosphoesterase family protein [Gemmatales bacterium]